MKSYAFIFVSFIVLLFSFTSLGIAADNPIRFIARGDDMGFSHATNMACIQAYREGILTTVEVIVPGPWFLDAVAILKDFPDLDVGVHLTLTSEWLNYKWGPITKSPSLANSDGYFPADNTGFINLNPSIEELEAELRKQIELAKKYIPQVSHLSYHMGTALATTAWTELTYRLSVEYNLPMGPAGDVQYMAMWGEPFDQKENYLANTLTNLQPGLYVFVCHLGYNNAETQAIIGAGNDASVRMSIHRENETGAVCSDRIKQIIVDRNIQLESYANTYRSTSISADNQSDDFSSHVYQIYQNYPNPFNPSTVISYKLSINSDVRLSIYNVLGQEIKALVNSFQSAGEHSVVWDARDEKDHVVSSGVYFYSLIANQATLRGKMMLIR